MEKLLKMLENDATLTPKELALMLSKEEGDIKEMIRQLEKDGVILGYQAIIDWDKTDKESVSALIEVKVMPQRDDGFDKIAEKIQNYPEIKGLYLMSGGFDFTVLIEGKTMKEVAYFVAKKLAPIEHVTATSTHFVLKTYKDKGVVYTGTTDGKSAVSYAIDADEGAAFYRVEVLDERRVNQPIISIGNPIWND